MATEKTMSEFINTYEYYMRELIKASAMDEASYMNGTTLHKLAGNAAYLHMVKTTGLLPRLNKMSPNQRKDMNDFMRSMERKHKYNTRWSEYMTELIGVEFYDEFTLTNGRASSQSMTEKRIASLTGVIEEMVGGNLNARSALARTEIWPNTQPSKERWLKNFKGENFERRRQRIKLANELRDKKLADLKANATKPVDSGIRAVKVDERGVQRNPVPQGIDATLTPTAMKELAEDGRIIYDPKKDLPYSEHVYLQLDEIMDRYNHERFTNAYDLPLYDIEETYAKELLGEETVKNAASGDEIRARLTEQSIADKREADRLRQDRFQINEMRQALFDADKQSRDIYDVLTKDARYKDLSLAKSVVNSVNTSGIKNNDEILYQLRRMMETGVAVGKDGLAMRDESGKLIRTLNYTIGTGVGDEHRTVRDMTDYMTKIMNRMSRPAEAGAALDQTYKAAIEANDRFFKYREMLDVMYAERRELNTDFSGFIKIMDDEIEGKVHGMDTDEYKNLVADRRRLIEVAESNEEFYKRHQEAIEKSGLKPVSPINQIRNAMINTLVSPDEKESIAATDETLRILRDGRDMSGELRASVLAEHQAMIDAHSQRVAELEARKAEMMAKADPETGIYKDPETGKTFMPSAIKTDIEAPAPLTEEEIKARIGERFETHERNTRKLSWDTYQALEEKWGVGGQDYDQIRAAMDEAGKPAGYQVITPDEAKGRFFSEWNAVDPDQRLYVGGDVVARRKVGLDGKWVTLEAEHILMSDIRTNINVQGSLEDLFAEIAEREYRDNVDKEMLHSRTDSVIKQNIIEVTYEQQWVNEELRAKNEGLYNWLSETEGRTKQVANNLGIPTGVVTKQVTGANLIEQFNLFMTPVNDMTRRNSNQFRLPQFLQDAVHSHANWMWRTGNADEIMSMAYDALEQTMVEYGKGQKSIDLRDEGFVKAWERQGKTPAEIAKLTAALQEKTLKQRFEDAIFLDVVGKMHQSWFEYSRATGNDAINSLIYQMADMIDETKKMDGSTIKWMPEPDADDFDHQAYAAMDEAGKEKYLADWRSNQQEFGTGRDNIKVTQGATRDLSHLEATASRIKAMARQARGTLDAFPFYSSVLGMSNSEISQVLLDRDKFGATGMNFMEHLQRMAGITVDPEDGGTYQDVLEQLADEQERDRIARDTRRASEYDQRMNDKVAMIDELKPVIEGDVSTRDKLLDKEEEVRKLLASDTVQGPGDLQTRIQIQAAQGQDYLPATANIGGKSYDIRITQGSQGEYLAEIPELGVTRTIVQRAEDAREAYMTDDLKPMTMHGGTVIQDIGNPGQLQADYPFVYDDVQTKGRGFRTQANPSDTLALMDEFRKGGVQIPYFDMETTGVDNSKLPKRMLQPLEVYAQKMEWDPEKNDFVRQRNGEIGVRNAAGKAVEDSIHLFVRPTEEMERYMNLLNEKGTFQTALTEGQMERIRQLKLPIKFGTEQIKDADGKVVARQYSIHALEYGRLKNDDKKRLQKALYEFEGGRRTVTSLEKEQSRLWFLRNIAKFAKNDNFEMHAGDAKLTSNYMDTLRADAETGMKNLKLVGQTDSRGRQRVRFSPNQEVVTSPFEMSQKLQAFIGDAPIAGQNVAEADWQKVVKGIQDHGDAGRRALNEATQQARQKITSIQNQMLDQIAENAGLDDRWAYVRSVTETPTTTRTVVTGRTEDGRLTGVNVRDPLRVRNEDGTSKLVQYQKRAYEPIAPGSLTPEQIQQGVREGTIVPMADRTGPKSFATPYSQTNTPTPIADVKERRREVVRGWINDFMESKTSGKVTVGDNPLIGREDFVSTFDQLNDLSTKELTPETLAALDEIGQRTGIDFGTEQIRSAQSTIRQAEKAMDEVSNPRILEQMFASRMAHPEEQFHSAKVQIQRSGIEMKGQLHSAKADVHAGMEVTGQWLKDIFGRDDMQNYQSRPLQVGSMVEHTRKLQNDLPLGIYEVTDIGEKHLGLRDIDGNDYTVKSDTATDLHRRYHNNFRFLEGDDIDSATRAFAEDAARNYIDNANQSAYTYDLHDLHRKEIAEHGRIVNQPLQNMAEIYKGLGDTPQGLPEQVAANNPHIFETNKITDLLGEETTARERLGFQIAGGYYDSAEGQARKRFLDNLDALKAVGGIEDDDAKQILRNFNEQIKEEGRRRGYTRKLNNKVAVNIPNMGYGRFGGQTRSIDISSPKAISDSIWGMAESMKELGGEALARTGVTDITDESKKATTLNTHVMNILRENGLIDDYKEGKRGRTSTPPTVSAAAQQILSRKDTFAPFEEYDLLGYKDRPQDFIDFIDETHQGVLGNRMEQLSPLQREKFDNYLNTIMDLKTGEQGYHPALRIDPRVDESATPTGTVRFTNYGGISQFEPDEIVRIGEDLKTSTDIDINTKNAIYGDLFKQATAGREYSMEGIMNSAHEPRRVAAMEALGWVKPVTDADREAMNSRATDVVQEIADLQSEYDRLRSDGAAQDILAQMDEDIRRASGEHNRILQEMDFAERTNRMWNPDVADWRFGLPGEYASSRIGDMPSSIVHNIVDGVDTRYTNLSGLGPLRQALGGWIDADMPGRSPNAPVLPQLRTFTPATVDHLMQQGMKENEAKELLRQMHADIKERGAKTKRGKDKVPMNVELESLDKRPTYAPQGVIGEHVERLRNGAKSAWDNFATAMSDSGAGKAAMWIAGLGLGAYALKQMFTAGDPLKIERQPIGHGGTTIAGYDGSDDPGPAPNKAKTGGGTAYETVDNGGRTGYKLQARAVDNSNLNYDEVANKLNEGLGSNLNINMRDEMTSMDRKWLGEQMGTYIDRGHL